MKGPTLLYGAHTKKYMATNTPHLSQLFPFFYRIKRFGERVRDLGSQMETFKFTEDGVKLICIFVNFSTKRVSLFI